MSNLDKILDEQEPSALARAARRGIRLVKSERDITNSCGCPWCDVGREPEKIDRALVHVIMHVSGGPTHETCTRRKVNRGRT